VAQGDYATESKLRARFKEWLGGLWTEKDARLDTMLPGTDRAATATASASETPP
jgi:hypothetical protein